MVVLVADGANLIQQREVRPGRAEGRRGPARAAGVFTPIGPNKPLTIRIAHVYTGRFPGKSLFGSKQDLLLTTAIKGQTFFDAAPRAINFHVPRVAQRSTLGTPAATDQGTSLVYYSPAITEPTLTLTLDLAFDSFPDELIRKIGGGFQGLAGLPIFAPYAGYLLIGSQLATLGADAGKALLEGGADASFTDTLDFDLPGYDQPDAAFRIVCGSKLDTSDLSFVPKRGLVRKSAPGGLYDGDEPYIVLSLDGRPDSKLEAFAPTMASAELLARFMSSASRGEATVDFLVDAAKLANDAKYRMAADEAERKIAKLRKAGAAEDEISKLTEERESLVKNIRSDLLLPPATTEPEVADKGHDAAAAMPGRRSAAAVEAAPAAAPQVQWRVAKCLLRLREQINARYPGRSKASDGTIGDAAHASRASDHNPWVVADGIGVVTAMDITHDPDSGCSARTIVDALVASRDPRIKYIIYDSQIIASYAVGAKPAWTARPYTGSNKHTKHFHLSCSSDLPVLDDEASWVV